MREKIQKTAVIFSIISMVSGGSMYQCYAEDISLYADQKPEKYTYENMQSDITALQGKYDQLFNVRSLGQTKDGRELYDLIIGKEDADKKIFINAGIHAREYMTCELVMKQTAEYLRHVSEKDSYESTVDGQAGEGGISYEKMWETCQIHVMPMVNPDGVSISQFGLDGLLTEEMRTKVISIASLDGQPASGDYLVNWKSNGCGVDLNRNFDALWESYADPAGHPSSESYKGSCPGSERESAAMIDLTGEQGFGRTISYHAQGSVIYWYFGQEGQLYDDTKAFGERISSVTGYVMDGNYQALDPAGYKDWAISKMGIPSLTIEIGTDTVPLPVEQFDDIWNKNKSVWEECIIDYAKSDIIS